MKTTLVALLLLASSATAHARGWYCYSLEGEKVNSKTGEARTGVFGQCKRTKNACVDAFILEKNDEHFVKSKAVGPVCEAQPVAYAYSKRAVGFTFQIEVPTLAICQQEASNPANYLVVVRQCHEVK